MPGLLLEVDGLAGPARQDRQRFLAAAWPGRQGSKLSKAQQNQQLMKYKRLKGSFPSTSQVCQVEAFWALLLEVLGKYSTYSWCLGRLYYHCCEAFELKSHPFCEERTPRTRLRLLWTAPRLRRQQSPAQKLQGL